MPTVKTSHSQGSTALVESAVLSLLSSWCGDFRVYRHARARRHLVTCKTVDVRSDQDEVGFFLHADQDKQHSATHGCSCSSTHGRTELPTADILGAHVGFHARAGKLQKVLVHKKTTRLPMTRTHETPKKCYDFT